SRYYFRMLFVHVFEVPKRKAAGVLLKICSAVYTSLFTPEQVQFKKHSIFVGIFNKDIQSFAAIRQCAEFPEVVMISDFQSCCSSQLSALVELVGHEALVVGRKFINQL